MHAHMQVSPLRFNISSPSTTTSTSSISTIQLATLWTCSNSAICSLAVFQPGEKGRLVVRPVQDTCHHRTSRPSQPRRTQKARRHRPRLPLSHVAQPKTASRPAPCVISHHFSSPDTPALCKGAPRPSRYREQLHTACYALPMSSFIHTHRMTTNAQSCQY